MLIRLITIRVKSTRWTLISKSSYKKSTLKFQNNMKTLIKWTMSVRKSSSTNLNLWHGSKIATVLRKQSRRRSTVLKSSKQGWSVRWKHNFKMSSSCKSKLLSMTLREISKALKEVSILKIKPSLKRPWARDISSTFTNVRNPRCSPTPRHRREVSHSNRMPLKNMKREVWINRKRSKSLRKRFLFWRSHFNKSYMTSRKKRNCLSFNMNRLLWTRRKT